MTVLKSNKVLMRVLCVFVMLWQALLCMEPNNSIKRKMSVRQNLIAKNKFILWVEYAVFGSQIQNNRRKQIFLRLFGGKNKNFAKY